MICGECYSVDRTFPCREAPASAADQGANATTNKLLCDEECLAKLDDLQTRETKSGLKYKDIVVGTGPSPPVGYQVLQPCPAFKHAAHCHVFGSDAVRRNSCLAQDATVSAGISA